MQHSVDIRRGCFVACLILCIASAGGAELAVGPGKGFERIEDALAQARAGDVIVVHPRENSRPYEKVALSVTTPRLTLRAATQPAGRVRLSGAGFDYSGRGRVPRAIVQFNAGSDGCALEGFDLSGAHNQSFNGAGVRINQASDITIRDCQIHDNDMGIMSNGDGTQRSAVNQLIESCLIHSNGNAKHPGYNHNLYLGGTSVRLVGCDIHSSLTGHNIKSRAHLTMVLACFVHDSANRELDLVDARGDTTAADSHAVVAGCIIAKSPRCTGNRGVIHFGQDGGQQHDGTLFLVHNTIVTPFISPVVMLSAPAARAELYNNIIWDNAAAQAGQKLVDAGKSGAVAGQGNWLASGFDTADRRALGLVATTVGRRGAEPPWRDAARRDMRPARPDVAITDAGQPLPEVVRKLIGPDLRQFAPPLGHQRRPTQGKPDLGAYEWSEQSVPRP